MAFRIKSIRSQKEKGVNLVVAGQNNHETLSIGLGPFPRGTVRQVKRLPKPKKDLVEAGKRIKFNQIRMRGGDPKKMFNAVRQRSVFSSGSRMNVTVGDFFVPTFSGTLAGEFSGRVRRVMRKTGALKSFGGLTVSFAAPFFVGDSRGARYLIVPVLPKGNSFFSPMTRHLIGGQREVSKEGKFETAIDAAKREAGREIGLSKTRGFQTIVLGKQFRPVKSEKKARPFAVTKDEKVGSNEHHFAVLVKPPIGTVEEMISQEFEKREDGVYLIKNRAPEKKELFGVELLPVDLKSQKGIIQTIQAVEEYFERNKKQMSYTLAVNLTMLLQELKRMQRK